MSSQNEQNMPDSTSTPGDTGLVVSGLMKRYLGTQALGGVGFTVKLGQVVGLVGENGAGKSTLLNVICGTTQPDSGTIELFGRSVRPQSYHHANEIGIFRIFQELSLIPNLPVYENIFLSHETHFTRGGIINHREMARRAAKLFEELDHGWIDVRKPAGSFDFATRQSIEIVKTFALARLLNIKTPVLLLDEPTSALSREEIDSFFKTVQAVRKHSICVFVSHRLSEILEISDRLLVLKDGEVVTEQDMEGVTEEDLHELMVGRTRADHFYKETSQRVPDDAVRLEVKGLTSTEFSEIDLTLRAGEIIGIAGVMGAGKTELARAISGIQPFSEGTIAVDGQVVETPTVPSMLDAGLGYVTPDRGDEGIFPGFSVSWNISIAKLARSKGSILDLSTEAQDAHDYVRKLRVKTDGINISARTLSGGNQQKLLLARWLAFGVKVLVLDNPTRGVDAGAKEEIYGLLRDLADNGVAILVVSDDLLEVIGLSNELLVMKDGVIKRKIPTPPDSKPEEIDIIGMMV